MADKKWKISAGNPARPGISVKERGVNFAIAAGEGADVKLILLTRGGRELRRVDLPENPAFGDMRAVFIEGLHPGDACYRYEVDGEPVRDPHAGGILGDLCYLPDPGYSWGDDAPPSVLPEDLILYKLHVRGFTKRARGIKHRGSFSGVAEMIPYLKGLHVNAVEFMPVYEWEEDLKVHPYTPATAGADGVTRAEPLRNYWGYAQKNSYFAPRAAYASGNDPSGEIRDMVRALHEAGILVIFEMYFPDGCDPFAATEAVRFWKLFYHADGFHLIGGGVPAVQLVHDALLARTLLLFEHIDHSWFKDSGAHARRHIFEINDQFEHTLRRFLKSDDGQAGEFARLIRRNPQEYGVVNYAAGVNGFTLFDSVCYDRKHNEENGENNADGTALNYSWNCGVEGPSKRKAVKELRLRQVRNALLYTFLAQGAPMLLMGDESLNTQNGNNNAYASDNPTGWKDWGAGSDVRALTEFTGKLAAFRAAHPVFHMKKEFRGTDYRSTGVPDLSYHDSTAWACSFENDARTLAVLYNGMYTRYENLPEDDFFLVACNAHWESHDFALPPLPKGYAWFPAIDTAAKAGEEFAEEDAAPLADQKFFKAKARSAAVFRGKKIPGDGTEVTDAAEMTDASEVTDAEKVTDAAKVTGAADAALPKTGTDKAAAPAAE